MILDWKHEVILALMPLSRVTLNDEALVMFPGYNRLAADVRFAWCSIDMNSGNFGLSGLFMYCRGCS